MELLKIKTINPETEKRLETTIPQERQATHKRAEKWIQLGQYKEIITDCDKLIGLKKANASTYYYKGLADLGLREYRKAIKNFTKAIELNSKYEEAYNTRGRVYGILEENDLAKADFTKAVNSNPRYAEAYFYRALLHHTEENYELALADYENTLFLDPKNKIARVNRSIAIEILEKKLQQNQNFLYQPAY